MATAIRAKVDAVASLAITAIWIITAATQETLNSFHDIGREVE